MSSFNLVLIALMCMTMIFIGITFADVFRYILQQHRQHEMEKRFWQIRRKRIREQTNEKTKNSTQEGRFHENHKN